MCKVRLTHEKIIGVRHISTNAKEFHEIMELTMNVTAYLSSTNQSMFLRFHTHALRASTYCHRRVHTDYVALFYEKLPCLVAEFAHLNLWYRSTCS